MKKGFLILCLFLSFKYIHSQFPKYLYGTISFYGDEFKGKRTASGEIFDPNAYTAAHKSLPFGTEIMVENLENGRKVKLKINDRGPFVANRILDVSKRAAEELGFVRKGTAYAKITILKIRDNKVEDFETEETVTYSSSSIESSLASAQSSSQAPSVSVQAGGVVSGASTTSITGTITPTNFVSITKTNEIFITNRVTIQVTNVIEIPPYEDKIVEKPLTQDSTENEFILEEPEDFIPLPQEKEFETTQSSSFSYKSTLSNITEVSSSSSSKEFEVIEKETVIDFSETNAPSITSIPKIPEAEGKYLIQVGAYLKENNALRIYELLRKEKFPVFTTEEVVKGKKWITVRIGYFNSKESAEEALKKLEKHRLSGIILKK